MLLWIANTGVRATEFCNQRWCDISQDQKSIEIFGKGRKTRPVPLNNTCRAILTRQTKLSDNDFIFKNLRGGILNRYALFQYCSEISKHPEFKKISKRPFGPHALRHWFATSLLLRGVSIQLVSKLLGHASIQITEKTYIHILPKHLEGITDCL